MISRGSDDQPESKGHETHMVLHCPECSWRSEVTRGMAMQAICPQCDTRHRMRFIKFDRSELAQVNGLLGKEAWPVRAEELEDREAEARMAEQALERE